MQTINIIKKIKASDSFLFKSICDKYDLDLDSYEKTWNLKFDYPENWKVGLIVGDSGSGKSIVARELFENVYEHNLIKNKDCPLIDNFNDKTINEITNAFLSVGLGSPPEWINSYSSLSTGQKMRADLATCILSNENLIAFDEFTSVVDRNVAKALSHCIAKAFRNSSKQFVAITCHFDVEEWLCPDWVLDLNSKEFYTIKKKDQTLKSKYFHVNEKYGSFSKSITI